MEQTMTTFKTPKGTELPFLNLKGKNYLQVMHRVQWFREEHPDYMIETEPVALTETHAIFKAIIRDAGGKALATGHKREDQKSFPDYMEKAESGAIGRALALCGYGTQFAQELEEGPRIVDSPAPSREAKAASIERKKPSDLTLDQIRNSVINFGKKHKGKKYGDVDIEELRSFQQWCKQEPERTQWDEAKEFVAMVEEYLGYLDAEPPQQEQIPF